MGKSWADGYVTTNGIRLHYHRTGGDKPPLVLSHGITDSGLCWRRVAEALEAEYDVVMVDARGHGLSDRPERDYSREEHARDLAGVIRILGLEPARVMGHSMGGAITTVLAATEPSLVRSAVLEDPPWRALTYIPSPVSAEDWARRIAERHEMSREQVIAVGKLTNPTWSAAEFDDWAIAKHQVSPLVVNFIGKDTTPWADYISRIQCPALLVTGDTSLGAIVSSETAAEATRLNPHVREGHIAGAGHNIRREQFDAYLALVRAFLAEQ